MKVVQNHADVARYVEEWDSTKYAKAILYGQVAVTIMGCLYDPFIAKVYFSEENLKRVSKCLSGT